MGACARGAGDGDLQKRRRCALLVLRCMMIPVKSVPCSCLCTHRNAAVFTCGRAPVVAAAVLVLTLLASANSCMVVIVSPTSGSARHDGSPFSISYRVKSTLNSCHQPIVSAVLRIDGNSVLESESQCDSFLPLVVTAPALACCLHILELCVSNLPASCTRSNVTIIPPPARPWSPTITGGAASVFVAHNELFAAALSQLLPAHEPLLDMSCDKYLLSHRGARTSLGSGNALTFMRDYSRRPLSLFSHCISECAALPSHRRMPKAPFPFTS